MPSMALFCTPFISGESISISLGGAVEFIPGESSEGDAYAVHAVMVR